MQRKLTEVMASQRKMIIRRGEDPDKVNESELGGILENHLRQVDNWIEGQANIERMDIDYNRIIADPNADIERINKFLSNSLDVDKMAQVIDPNLYRQRK